MMEEKRFYTIGEAVKHLQSEFPELTISKVRFLEDKGLVKPYRTSGGYRKFSRGDIVKLRALLLLQKEEYLPLEVIRKRLTDFNPETQDAEALLRHEDHSADTGMAIELPKSMTLEEAPQRLGVPMDDINELEYFGIIHPHRDTSEATLGATDIQLISLSREMRRFGIYPKHLRMYLNYTEKEVDLFRQILLPIANQHNPEGRRKAESLVSELLQYSKQFKHLLLKTSLENIITEQ